MEQSFKGIAPALERGLELIELVAAADEPLGFTCLEKYTGIPKATLNRLLKVLCGMDYLEKSPDGKYQPGRRCGMLGRPNDIESALLEYGKESVKRVCHLTNNTCLLFYWDGKQTRVCAKEMHEMSLSMQPVGNVSADYEHTPWGWIFLEAPEMDLQTAEKSKFHKTDMFREKFKFYQEHGYMIDDNRELARLAVPVYKGGRIIGALGLGVGYSSPAQDILDEFGRIMIEEASALSRKLS